MKLSIGNRTVFGSVAVQAVLSLFAVIAIEYFVSTTTNNLVFIRLAHKSTAERASLENDIRKLQAAVDSAHAKLSSRTARACPSINELKEAANGHGLQLKRVERVTTNGRVSSGRTNYTIVVRGEAAKDIEFLHELEERWLFNCQTIQLQRSDETGQLVDLGMTLEVTDL
jgi:hypothetical protein